MIGDNLLKLRIATIAACLFAASLGCHAQTTTFGVLPTVTVTGTADVDWNGWGGYNPFYSSSLYFSESISDYIDDYVGTAQEGAALYEISTFAAKVSVCIAPVSTAAKSTLSTSDTTNRWLAAQEVYTYIVTSGNLSLINGLYRDLSFVIDGRNYKGFTVSYADGVRETWAVTPNAATSSVKLLDEPMPNSQEPYKNSVSTPKCNVG
jgi:hypothetical protein